MNRIYKILIVLSMLSLLTLSSRAFSQVNVSKEDWLKSFKALAPTAICNGIMSVERTATLLKENNIDPEKCKSMIMGSLNRCLDKYGSEMPTMIEASQSKDLGEKLGKCSGEDFYSHYISKTS